MKTPPQLKLADHLAAGVGGFSGSTGGFAQLFVK